MCCCGSLEEEVDVKRRRGERRRCGPGILSESQRERCCEGIDEAAVERFASDLGLDAPRFFARGQRGVIYRAQSSSLGVVAIKARRQWSDEARWLRVCGKFGVGPKLYGETDRAFAMEFVDGLMIGQFLETEKNASVVVGVLKDLVRQCRLLDDARVHKREMHRCHRSVLVRHGKCVLIDFERSVLSAKPQNFTGLCQYLASNFVSRRLEKSFDIHLDHTLLRAYLRAYKKTLFENRATTHFFSDEEHIIITGLEWRKKGETTTNIIITE